MAKETALTQVVKGVEKLTDKQLRERTRQYIPSAIERLAELCNSNNDSVALGALKVMLAKNLPDLKAMEITGKDGERLIPVPIYGGKSTEESTDV